MRQNLNWTNEQAQAHLQRARAGWRRDPGDTSPFPSGTPTPVLPTFKPEYDSKLEAAYAQRLLFRKAAGEIVSFRLHPLKFRLAKRTWFTPDFLVVTQDLEIHEVKGWMRDDAAVKLKTCAEMFPWFRWFLAKRDKGGAWDIREVGLCR